MVAGYQRRPPWAVGMRSALSPSAIAARLLPAARSCLIRSITYSDICGGRPSRTPCARLSASAAFVRSEIEPRSQGAKVASTLALAAAAVVAGSAAQSSATSAQRLVEPLALGGDARVRGAALEQPQRLLEAGTVPLLRCEAGLVARLER